MEKFYRIKMVADKSKLSEEGITEEELFRKVENVCKNCANIIKEKENIYKSNDYHALRRFCDKLNENLELTVEIIRQSLICSFEASESYMLSTRWRVLLLVT